MNKIEIPNLNSIDLYYDCPVSQYTGLHELLCHKCRNTGFVIACDYCPLVFHPHCLTPLMTKRPKEYWICPICKSNIDNGDLQAIYNRRDHFVFTSNHIPSEKKSIDEFPSVSMQNKHTKSRTNASTGLPYTSCFRGVYNRGNKWNAQIQFQGKKYYLGTYNSEWEAAHMYDRAAMQYHGSHAKLNFSYDFSTFPSFSEHSPTTAVNQDNHIGDLNSIDINNDISDISGNLLPQPFYLNENSSLCNENTMILTPTMFAPYEDVCTDICKNRDYISNHLY